MPAGTCSGGDKWDAVLSSEALCDDQQHFSSGPDECRRMYSMNSLSFRAAVAESHTATDETFFSEASYGESQFGCFDQVSHIQ